MVDILTGDTLSFRKCVLQVLSYIRILFACVGFYGVDGRTWLTISIVAKEWIAYRDIQMRF